MMMGRWLPNALHEHHSPHHEALMNPILETIYVSPNTGIDDASLLK